MEIIQENINNIRISDVIYLKLAHLKGKRCVVAGLKSGRRVPLTKLESPTTCSNPLYELNMELNGELLNDFYVGDGHLFAVKKGEVKTLYVIDEKNTNLVKVGAKFETPLFRDFVDLAYQPNTKWLSKIRQDIREDYLERQSNNAGESDGCSIF